MEQFGPARRRSRRPQTPEWQRFFAEDAGKEHNVKLDMALSDAGLQVRTVNTLETVKIFLVRDLIQRDRDTLLTITNFGEKTLDECRKAMDTLGVKHPNWNRPRKKRKSSKR